MSDRFQTWLSYVPVGNSQSLALTSSIVAKDVASHSFSRRLCDKVLHKVFERTDHSTSRNSLSIMSSVWAECQEQTGCCVIGVHNEGRQNVHDREWNGWLSLIDDDPMNGGGGIAFWRTVAVWLQNFVGILITELWSSATSIFSCAGRSSSKVNIFPVAKTYRWM